MDLDKDGYITEEELRKWLKHVASRYVEQDVKRTYDGYVREFKTDYITFEQHKTRLSDDFDEDEDSDGKFSLEYLSSEFIQMRSLRMLLLEMKSASKLPIRMVMENLRGKNSLLFYTRKSLKKWEISWSTYVEVIFICCLVLMCIFIFMFFT